LYDFILLLILLDDKLSRNLSSIMDSHSILEREKEEWTTENASLTIGLESLEEELKELKQDYLKEKKECKDWENKYEQCKKELDSWRKRLEKMEKNFTTVLRLELNKELLIKFESYLQDVQVGDKKIQVKKLLTSEKKKKEELKQETTKMEVKQEEQVKMELKQQEETTKMEVKQEEKTELKQEEETKMELKQETKMEENSTLVVLNNEFEVQLNNMIQEKKEKKVLDDHILLVSPTYDTNGVPLNSMLLFDAIQQWSHSSFLDNVILAVDFTIDRFSSDLTILTFWMNSIQTLFNLLNDQTKDEIFKKHNTFLDSFKIQKQIPTFITSGSSSTTTSETFLISLHQLLEKIYLILLEEMKIHVEKIIHQSIFSQSMTNNGYFELSNEIEKTLNQYFNLFKKNNLPMTLIHHLFISLGYYMDTYIFNSFLQSNVTSYSKGVQMKLYVSTLEQWYDEIRIHSPDLFKYSRQSSDVCIVSDKMLLVDETTRKSIYPNLNLNQIHKILSNFVKEEKDAIILKVLSQFKVLSGELKVDVPKVNFKRENVTIFKKK
jgi:hypothetical protein